MTEKVKSTERSKTIMMTTTMMMGGGGSVVGNNNANLVTIPMITLIDLSEENEEENKSRDIAQIDVKGTLSEAINWYTSKQPLNGTSSNSNSSNSEGSTNHRNDLTPGKL